MTETLTEGMRHCSGSAKFGIEPHEALIEDFPVQPSQKDGLGRMCRPHWNQYTIALRKAALARKAAEAEAPLAEAAPVEEPEATKPATSARRARAQKGTATAEAAADAAPVGEA